MQFKTTIVSLFLFSLILLPASTVGAQPSVPPGLEGAPPCVEPGMMPTQARVPCLGIVAFQSGTSAEEREAKIQEAGGHLRVNYQIFNAAAVGFEDETSLNALQSDPSVVAVIPDRRVHGFPKPDKPGKPGNGGGDTGGSGQEVSAGLTRIGAAPGVLPVTGQGMGVAVVDTGIDMNNADLTVSPTCFTAFTSCEDGDGHGTHVSGIVAANDNDIDSVGVAPDATLYAVKVLDDTGSGDESGVIAGLEWVALNADSVNPPIDVVNMSLGRQGTLGDNPLFHQAVQTLTGMGIPVVVAAGNDETLEVIDNVPATYPEVIAVASSTAEAGNNKCKWFSGVVEADTASFFTTDGMLDGDGIGVTISAPGAQKEDIGRSCHLQSSGILSLKAGGGTTRMSGTSMATPFVTGVAALILEDEGGAIDPEGIRDRLRNTADRVGIAPLDSPASSYSFDGEREGILSACGALGVACP